MSDKLAWLTPFEDVTYPHRRRPNETVTFRRGSGVVREDAELFKKHPKLRRSFVPVDSPEGRAAATRYQGFIDDLNEKSGLSPALARSKQDGPRDYLAPPDSDRSSWYLPAGTTVTVEREIPELRRKATPAITVSLSERVWQDLRRHAREARDGRETGGFFFGERIRTYKPVSVARVMRMVTERRAEQCRLDIDALYGEKRVLRASGTTHVDEQGSWHTHPGSSGIPSDSDLTTWLNGLDYLGRSFYVGLILTAEANDERWSSPNVHGWVVRRNQHTNTAVCEPAIVKTGRG